MKEEIKQFKDNTEAWKEGQKDELTELRKHHDSSEFENTFPKLEVDYKKKMEMILKMFNETQDFINKVERRVLHVEHCLFSCPEELMEQKNVEILSKKK